jgi:NhaP-type Na+/H+ or K+/H+ antiporter
MTDPITVLALVAGVGVAAQAIADRTKVPAIVLLLGSGLVLGPGVSLLEPDEVYGRFLFPGASLAVAFLLFDGGLSLRVRDLEDQRLVLARLLSVGVVVTWVVSGLAAFFTGVPFGVAALFGAIMTVTGPTVVIPLLREARLRPRIARILRWEGILIDPIGAVLAVVTVEAVVEGHGRVSDAVGAIAATFAAGAAVGFVFATIVVLMLCRHLVRDRLEVPVIIGALLVAVALANSIYDEAGLVAATALGVALGNQRWVDVRRLLGFHESLAVVLVGIVFVLLAARVEPGVLRRQAPAGTFVPARPRARGPPGGGVGFDDRITSPHQRTGLPGRDGPAGRGGRIRLSALLPSARGAGRAGWREPGRPRLRCGGRDGCHLRRGGATPRTPAADGRPRATRRGAGGRRALAPARR